jgi:hypothetical protein
MKKLLKRILLVFAALTLISALTLAYSYFIEPSRLIIKRETVNVPNWSANLDGFKVVAISDIHGGSNNVTEERLRLLVNKANEQAPDLIVLLGDYISEQRHNRKELRMPVETISENLRGFQAKYGVYAVIGNHDWQYNEGEITAAFERAGISVLDNEIIQIKVGDETVNLWGIEDYWKKRRVPVEPLGVLPGRKNIIAVTHNPDALLKTPAEIAVMFAGHSHGGQVSFPFYGGYPFVNDRRFMAGHAEVENKNIFVTTGVGCTGPQIRFRVPPEIAVININARK